MAILPPGAPATDWPELRRAAVIDAAKLGTSGGVAAVDPLKPQLQERIMPILSFASNPLNWTVGVFPVADDRGNVTARRYCFGPYVVTWQ